MNTVYVWNSDCLMALSQLDDESIHSIITDPPYDLVQTKSSSKTGGFMGKAWDSTGIAFNVDLWKECLRVLKPGGHLLSFGGTRTYHRMACAVEDAGFEIRDSILHVGSLHWVFGSGFPKSQNVSKAIDKAAGAEREVVGIHRFADGKQARATAGASGMPESGASGQAYLTAPATDAAKQWEGWGTALKPSHEPIVVARKPLAGTVAANVQQHGTGGLNIGATRVGATVETWPKSRSGIFGSNGQGAPTVKTGEVPSGRWPPNLVFTHQKTAWRILKDELSDEVFEAIIAYYRTIEGVRLLWSNIQGDAIGSQEAEVLLEEVCRPISKECAEDRMGQDELPRLSEGIRDISSMGSERSQEILQQGVPGESEYLSEATSRQSSYSGISGQNEREYNSDVQGEVLSMEGRAFHSKRIHSCDDRFVIRADTETSATDDLEQGSEVHSGTSGSDGGDIESASDRGRGSASHQWRQSGQSTQKFDSGSESSSFCETSRGRTQSPSTADGSGTTEARKPRLAVPAWAIPEGWNQYFIDIGTTSACTETECASDCPVAELDRQSGSVQGSHTQKRLSPPGKSIFGAGGCNDFAYSDSGGASRFFPCFRYQAKAPPKERPKVNGISHPTTKPLELMKWLVRLVTPLGGIVLDPFVGSGTTLEAAYLEGFLSIGIENYADYIKLIEARFEKHPDATLKMINDNDTD